MTFDKYKHTSEPVATAMEVVWSLCDTDFLLATHADALPCRPDALSSMIDLASPVVGYRMSPRNPHTIWDYSKMLSHTFTVFDMRALRKKRIIWSMRTPTDGDVSPHDGWPDTEVGFNWSLWEAGITPLIVGDEQNYAFDKTDHYWHVRSLYSGAMRKGSPYARDLKGWKREAIEQANQWEKEWSF